ncbi:MAG: hypothetical protein KA004_01340 [Verrucomicrobiales bacterium]|nr:hypothetical protein [Verrucomicrobiales bacterium]
MKSYYLSRSYVEIGPFLASELTAFCQRGVFREGDFIRSSDSDEWMPYEEGVSKLKPAEVKRKATAAAKAQPKPAADSQRPVVAKVSKKKKPEETGAKAPAKPAAQKTAKEPGS